MSRLTSIATILPGEAMTLTDPNSIAGSITRLNHMLGSASDLTALCNGANLDASNFRADAGIIKSQKVNAYSQYVMNFGFAGTQAVLSQTTTMDLLVWEPRPGTVCAFGDRARVDFMLNYQTTATAGTSTAVLSLYKQTQFGALGTAFASLSLTLDGAYHLTTATTAIPAGSNARINPEKQDRIVVQLVFTLGNTNCTFSRFDGALVLNHAHVRWND